MPQEQKRRQGEKRPTDEDLVEVQGGQARRITRSLGKRTLGSVAYLSESIL